MCLPLIVTFLSAASFVTAQVSGREITCTCTTTHCRQFGLRVCNTTGLCFSQYLDKRDGTNPLVRGCIESRTPLLCENRRPAVALHRDWPALFCCDKNMCNAKVTPTIPTFTEEVTTEYATTSGDASYVPSSSYSAATFLRNKVYIAVVLVGIFAVISIVILAIFLARRQAILFDAEFGRVSTNGYVKGCMKPPSCVPSKGLDNKFTLDT